tara:strand:- start:321 stop:1007 length:687 start_codon:yes stop_codon:yes gene_type:complete
MNGFILHEGVITGHRFVVIATGVVRPSVNIKTGGMIQIWILLTDQSPIEGVQSGLDADTICKGCPFASGHGCYVNLGHSPLGIWKAYHRGSYPALRGYSVFQDRAVRFGAYGNPSLIPLRIVKAIRRRAGKTTGYFHDWKANRKARKYNRYFMASTDTLESLEEAKAEGLRVFHASKEKPTGRFKTCLNVTHGIQCADCGLCNGGDGPDVWVPLHGSGAKKAYNLIQN